MEESSSVAPRAESESPSEIDISYGTNPTVVRLGPQPSRKRVGRIERTPFLAREVERSR
jgi:hypothetical protein